MAQVALKIVTDASEPGKVGFQVGPETRWLDNQDAREQLREAALRPTRWENMWEAIVRRLRDDGIAPRTATLAQIRNSVERAPLEI